MDAVAREVASFGKDADNVVGCDDMVETDFLGSGELAALAVYERVLELFGERPVYLVTDVFDRGTLSHHQWIREVGSLSALFGVDAVDAELVPHGVLEVVNVEVLFDRDDDRVGLSRELVHLLHADRVDLVVDVEAGDVVAVTEHHVDELVDSDVLSEHDIDVVHLVSLQDGTDHLFVNLGECETHGLGDDDTTGVLFAEDHIGLGLVETDTDGLEFPFEKCTMRVGLGGVQHDDDHVGGLGHGDDLSTSTLAFGSAFNDTRQIEDLDLGTFVLEDTRLACEGGEFVRGCFRLGVGNFGEETRLSDRGETDENYTCITGLHDIEALAGLARFLLRLEKLMTELGDLGTELTKMVSIGKETSV